MSQAFGEIVERLRRSTVAVSAHANGGGSGVIWSPGGTILTNAHVVDSADPSGVVQVELWDGRRLPGKILRKDRRRDLAALQVDALALPAGRIGDSSVLRAGELVIAVGNPLGFIGAASTGVIHGFHDSSWVVSQLRLAPGNSGGPLANASGEVIGINTMIAGGLAFAVPSNAVTHFLTGQSTADPGLGVVVRPVPAGEAKPVTALIVLEVIPGSPAERASLLQGDILVGANGKRFRSARDLEIAIQASRGGVLDLQFRRGTSASLRTVVAQLAPSVVRAA